MRLRPEVKVGLIVLISAIALGSIYVFFNGISRGGTYTSCAVFDDALRLAPDAEVRMAGVLVGKVSSIDLTPQNKAKVQLKISNKYAGIIPEDSTARITTGGVSGVGDYYVEIIPGDSKSKLKPNQCIRTASIPKLDDLLVQVKDIVSGLQGSVNSVNDILANPKTRQSLEQTVENVRIATEAAIQLVNSTNRIVAENEPEFQKLMANANNATADFAAITKDLRGAIEGGSVNDVQNTLKSASAIAANLEATTARLRKLAEDKQIEAQLRATIQNACVASAGAAEIVNRVQKVIGPRDQASKTPAGYVPDVGSRVDLYAETKNGPFRLDYNLTLPGRDDKFYRLGLFDIGESTKLNLQAGRVIDPRTAFRYGLYASRIGVGYDRVLKPGLNLQLDMYRPNDVALEAKIRYELSPNFGLWLGAADLFGDGGALFGMQYRK